VVTPRRGYLHHGIYIGDGRVVHYTGLANGLQRGPVEETSLARFGCGRPVWIKSYAPSTFGAQEVIRRARSRVGEDRYRLWTNNCEHFCEWCVRGEPRSYQVEAWLARPGRALRAIIRSPLQLIRFWYSFLAGKHSVNNRRIVSHRGLL
jgi:cell wall-associated NlpC family hydrolase